MEWPAWIRRQQGRYWLIVGLIAYLGAAIPSILRSIDGTAGDIAYMSIDWLAACVIYFFLGALFGHLLDWWLSPKKKIVHPLWWWLTMALWAVSSIVVGIVARAGILEPGLTIFFPFAFGIFFTGSAFMLIAPSLVQKTIYGKLFLDILYLALCGTWLFFAVRMKKHVTTTRILLLLVFAVLFLGVAGCVQSLA